MRGASLAQSVAPLSRAANCGGTEPQLAALEREAKAAGVVMLLQLGIEISLQLGIEISFQLGIEMRTFALLVT